MAPKEPQKPSQRQRESSGKKHHHKRRRSETVPSPRKSESAPEESRRDRRSHPPLSAGALAQLGVQNTRSSPRRASESRPHRAVGRRDSREAQQLLAERRIAERSRNHHKNRKRRVVSGAALEEGRGIRGLRGGAVSTDYSLGKDDLYHRPRSKKNRKKLCESYTGQPGAFKD